MNTITQNRILSIKNLNCIQTAQIRGMKSKTLSYVLDSVRKYDYENFLCTLLLRNPYRQRAMAIRGFNIEVAKVVEQVSQPQLGSMRLKFWKDTLDKCFGDDKDMVPQHPVAVELFKATRDTHLSKKHLKNLIEIRMQHMTRKNFRTLEEMEEYADQVVTRVYLLLLECAGIKNINADHAASHLGKAQGIVQQLKTLPIARRINFIGIPQEILSKYNVAHEEVLRRVPTDGIRDCTFDVASRAYQHLQKCRALEATVPKEATPILLPAVAVENYLERLENVHHDVFHPSLQRPDWLWLPKVWYKRLKNEY